MESRMVKGMTGKKQSKVEVFYLTGQKERRTGKKQSKVEVFYLTGQKENKKHSYNGGKKQSKVYVKMVIRPT